MWPVLHTATAATVRNGNTPDCQYPCCIVMNFIDPATGHGAKQKLYRCKEQPFECTLNCVGSCPWVVGATTYCDENTPETFTCPTFSCPPVFKCKYGYLLGSTESCTQPISSCKEIYDPSCYAMAELACKLSGESKCGQSVTVYCLPQ
ncbi:MAG: hypothetical protein UZ06_CHB003000950 [Chlorobi bacterium OLB6]|nr:MAG: hypothetical protein UZ06_CHB003000950 [Chlorobi bacterium OLB6]